MRAWCCSPPPPFELPHSSVSVGSKGAHAIVSERAMMVMMAVRKLAVMRVCACTRGCELQRAVLTMSHTTKKDTSVLNLWCVVEGVRDVHAHCAASATSETKSTNKTARVKSVRVARYREKSGVSSGMVLAERRESESDDRARKEYHHQLCAVGSCPTRSCGCVGMWRVPSSERAHRSDAYNDRAGPRALCSTATTTPASSP